VQTAGELTYWGRIDPRRGEQGCDSGRARVKEYNRKNFVEIAETGWLIIF
jgi:hypothetical protein